MNTPRERADPAFNTATSFTRKGVSTAADISQRITHSVINAVKHELTTVTRWQLYLSLVQAVNST